MPERWRPWRELRARADVEFVLCDLPPGVRAIWARRGPDRAILVNATLDPVDRLAAVAHELVHDERGHAGHDPACQNAYTAKEERIVDDIVARRLLPLDDLEAHVDARAEVEPITVESVAREFEVAPHVARRALELLAGQRRTA